VLITTARMDSSISNLIRLEGYKATQQALPTSLNVLVVDDEPLMVELLSRTLRDLGHETVATGSDGLQAVELARKHQPDLIVIDYAMPNMDGMEASELIMKEMAIPIVLSTGRTDDATLQRARKADIHSYLVKPFHREQLKTAITMAMVRHHEKLASEAKIAELQDELAVVIAVDLAASLLMEKFRIDRRDAIEKLETAARARSCSLLDASRAVAATLAPRPIEQKEAV
jgi:AmiR/NasT family two-component response regulator